jgi:UDP-glucose:(heptosyl)LPS alpha-1,3-glucosyltransferase
MRVALVIEHMDPKRGGRERSIAELALARRRCKVTVLCRTAAWEAPGVDIRPLGDRGGLRIVRLWNFVRDVQRETAAARFDIVHATLPVPGANVYQLRSGTVPAQRAASVRWRRGLGKARVLVGRSANVCRRYLGRLERQLVSRPTVLCLAVSEMVAGELRTHYGRRDGVRVIYNSVSSAWSLGAAADRIRVARRGELGLGRHDTLFVTLATSFELKGVAETIRAFACWQRRRHAAASRGRLVVIGRHQPGSYRRLAGRLGVADRVTFVPRTDQVRGWYAAADVCVLLSWYDPCSRVVLEATRLGIPSITTRHNGASEAVRHGAGLVVDSPADTDAVADAMTRLADPRQRQLCRAAALRISDTLSTSRHVDQIMAAYQDVIAATVATHPIRLQVVPSAEPIPNGPSLPREAESPASETSLPQPKKAA